MAIPSLYSDGSSPQELYFIASIENAVSIVTNGILSNKRAKALHPTDISNPEVQDRRENKIVPNPDRIASGKKELRIHRCANLYFRAHNAMLYVRREERDGLCVFRIDPRILLRKEATVSDKNASKDEAFFHKSTDFCFSPESSGMLKEPLSFIWQDPNQEKRKAVRQAEVLVPYQIHPSYVRGVYVANEIARGKLVALLQETLFQDQLPIDLHPSLFFSSHQRSAKGLNPLDVIAPSPLRNGVHPELVEDLPESSDEEAPQAAAADISDALFTMDD